MFEHSVKVPRLYKTAAKIAERVKLHGESVRQVYDDKLKHRNIKALYALIVSTVQNDSNLDFLLKKSELLRTETRLDPWLAKVLITELLWGKKTLPGESKPIKTILAYEQKFSAHLSDLEQPRNFTNKVDTPRYVRINTLKTSVQEAIEAFRDEGWILVSFLDKNDYPGFLSRISNLEESEFMLDIHVPYLLIFPPRTQFYNHNAYRNGLIALQDKASCLPAHILSPPEDSKVLDMCAAPGMKTTQLACLINGSGVIYAIERDLKRAKVLQNMVETAGATDCVRVVERDVLDVCKKRGGLVLDSEKDGTTFKQQSEEDLKDADAVYRDVEYILVDPSCSGSGMAEGPEKLGNFQTSFSRLKKLAGFQIMILKHALRSFPSAKRVVYSTCSLNVEENEEVVKEALQSAQNYKLVDAKTLCQPWVNFGSGDVGEFCLYSKPEQDLTTNGFFVAVFDRLVIGEENRFFVQRGFKRGEKVLGGEQDENECQGESERSLKGFEPKNFDVIDENNKINRYQDESECLEDDSLENGEEIGQKTKKKSRLETDESSDGKKSKRHKCHEESECLQDDSLGNGEEIGQKTKKKARLESEEYTDVADGKKSKKNKKRHMNKQELEGVANDGQNRLDEEAVSKEEFVEINEGVKRKKSKKGIGKHKEEKEEGVQNDEEYAKSVVFGDLQGSKKIKKKDKNVRPEEAKRSLEIKEDKKGKGKKRNMEDVQEVEEHAESVKRIKNKKDKAKK